MRGDTRKRMAGGLAAIVLGMAAYAAAVPVAPGPIDLNKASVEDLAKLPGIGPAKAQAIIQYRAQHPFAHADELRQVKGIGAKLFDQVKDQVTVGDAPAAAPKGRGS